MIEVDLRQLRKFEKQLAEFSRGAFLFAMRDSINDTAFFAMRETKKGIRRRFTTRNTFTERGIKVSKAKDLDRPVARMGSLQKYMVDQEFGGFRKDPAIPTTSASGEGKGAKFRKKAVKRKNRLSLLNVRKPRESLSIAGSIQEAVRSGDRIVFLRLKTGRAGIFEIQGEKGKRLKLIMLYDLSRPSITVKKAPTIAPATDRAATLTELFYKRQIERQLRRRGLFTGK